VSLKQISEIKKKQGVLSGGSSCLKLDIYLVSTKIDDLEWRSAAANFDTEVRSSGRVDIAFQ
jgi:hypothetical protein